MQVLISVISGPEARSLVDCGMDILDVKNPREGALGAAAAWDLKEIVDIARDLGIPSSAALGDLAPQAGAASLTAYGAAVTGVDFVKTGLLRALGLQEAVRLLRAIRRAVHMAAHAPRVVAVGYGDWRLVGTLSPEDLIGAARTARSDVVMLDTATKDGRSLLDHMSSEELRAFVDRARDAGLEVALAGSLKGEHRDLVRDIGPDIIGARGAVCDGGDRKDQVCPDRVRQFVTMFQAPAPARRLEAPASTGRIPPEPGCARSSIG